MTKLTLASSASSHSTTASELPESVRRNLAPVPATRGSPVVLLEPVVIDAPLPEGFIDIDDYIQEQENDPATKQAIAAGTRALADNYYGTEPRVLAWYRLKQGWSQKELATRMNTSQSYIARLEAGEIDPQVSTLRRLAAVFDVPAATLLDAIAQGVKRS